MSSSTTHENAHPVGVAARRRRMHRSTEPSVRARVRTIPLWAAVALAFSGVLGCGKDNAVAPMTDTSAPASTSDLQAITGSDSSIVLRWTAPGDDGTSGSAHSYEIRYSSNAADLTTPGGWGASARVAQPPAPLAAGLRQEFEVDSLSPRRTYYFALMAVDEAGISSGLSNVASATTYEKSPSLVLSWGARGAADGQFGWINGPSGLAVDRVRRVVYVADPGNGRVQKFDLEGAFLGAWPSASHQEFVTNAMAIDPSGDVYVGDRGGVVKYDSQGNILRSFTAGGSYQGVVATDAAGNAYVAREEVLLGPDRHWIDKYAPTGSLLLSWETTALPQALAVDSKGTVCALIDSRVHEFDGQGGQRGSWDPFVGGDADCLSGIGIDPDGTVYLSVGCSSGTHPRVMRFDRGGRPLGPFRVAEPAFEPRGVAIDNQHNIYVVDRGYGRVLKFARNETQATP